ncbi:hypothetical protein M0812_24983 [Anaeramoeba flamelloides]|uniref:DUF659 domain-containing protein n=1 Tax=Anaeramoeba flamelloides TaxID=1746091 RepID=A0AAV7YIH1_9EUKA|nr:hypothetical protein M0812_24983 [Anaeramoeba flamelloides]
MILLLNNIHCPCGRRKELLDLKESYGSFVAKLVCRKCPATQLRDNIENFHFSSKLDQKDQTGKKNKTNFKTENGQRKIVAWVLGGNFYENYREQMGMMGLAYLKKNSYQNTIDRLIEETKILSQKHLEANRSKMDLKNLTICVDTGWSSRRHVNECCFIVIDNKIKLLFDIIAITSDIFTGASGNMEAEAARFFCQKHKETIKLVGVVKDGDTKLAKIFEEAWKRVKILKDLNHLLKNVRKILKMVQISNIHDCCEHVMPHKDRYDFPPLNIIDKKFLLEKKNQLQDLIEKYLKILVNNIIIVEEKLNSKTMKRSDELYWMDVIEDLRIDRKNFSKLDQQIGVRVLGILGQNSLKRGSIRPNNGK